MSIELKQAAQQAIEAFDAFGDADDFATMFALTQKMNALRTALQQATQPAEVTDEQIAACVKRASTYGLPFVGLLNPGGTPSDFSKRFTAEILALRTAQAGVTEDVVRDAERYRFIRDADVSDDLIPDIALYAMESLDEYIDAAILAAAPKEGGAA